MRSDDIVPFAMKRMWVKIDAFHFFRGDFAAGRILAAIQPTGHGQSLGRRRLGNERDDGFVVPQRFPPPIGRDKGKEAMFDLVPFAGPGWKMTDRHRKTRGIHPGLVAP